MTINSNPALSNMKILNNSIAKFDEGCRESPVNHRGKKIGLCNEIRTLIVNNPEVEKLMNKKTMKTLNKLACQTAKKTNIKNILSRNVLTEKNIGKIILETKSAIQESENKKAKEISSVINESVANDPKAVFITDDIYSIYESFKKNPDLVFNEHAMTDLESKVLADDNNVFSYVSIARTRGPNMTALTFSKQHPVQSEKLDDIMKSLLNKVGEIRPIQWSDIRFY